MESAFGADGVVSARNVQPTIRLLYSKAQAAEMLSVSVRTIDYLIANKELAVRRIGKRCLIPHQSLVRCARQDCSGRRRIQ